MNSVAAASNDMRCVIKYKALTDDFSTVCPFDARSRSLGFPRTAGSTSALRTIEPGNLVGILNSTHARSAGLEEDEPTDSTRATRPAIPFTGA
jgi:hypothetical protein